MRRSKQNCGNCDAFWTVGSNPVGACRANAPVLMQGLQQSVAHAQPVPVIQGAWPPTTAKEWCRQWQPRDVDDELPSADAIREIMKQ